MAKILKFKEKDPYVSGKIKCINCGNVWDGIAPEKTDWLECKECGLIKGKFVYPHCLIDDDHWFCSCGNDLFQITKDCIYCPNCGEIQKVD